MGHTSIFLDAVQPWFGRWLWLVIVFALASSAPAPNDVGDGATAAKKKISDESSKVAMLAHSIIPPLSFKNVLESWDTSGSSIVERDGVTMHPAAAHRNGYFWTKKPVLTDNFEVTFHFRVAGSKEDGKVPSDQSFAFWYLHDAPEYDEAKVIKAPEWQAGLREQGYTLVGGPAKFNGFCVILSMADATNQNKPVVSVLTNDGSQSFEYGKNVPTPSAKPIEFRNTLNAAQLKIRVTKTEIIGYFKQSPSLSWNECFNIEASTDNKLTIKSGGYIGFTAYSGQLVPPGGGADFVSIQKVESFNFDDTSIGEDMADVSTKIQDAYREMLTDENRHFLDQKSQTEHIQRLTAMLADHAKQAPKADMKLSQDLQAITERLGRLEADCRTVVTELEVIVADGELGDPKTQRTVNAAAFKDDIIGIRQLLVKGSVSHREKIATVRNNVREVKDKHKDSHPKGLVTIQKQSEILKKTADVRGTTMTWMFLLIIICVLVVGLLMYNRMSYYEKKHFI